MERMSMKDKKTNIISMRISDEEMESVQKVVALTNQRVSVVMREALRLVLSQWVEAGPSEVGS